MSTALLDYTLTCRKLVRNSGWRRNDGRESELLFSTGHVSAQLATLQRAVEVFDGLQQQPPRVLSELPRMTGNCSYALTARTASPTSTRTYS